MKPKTTALTCGDDSVRRRSGRKCAKLKRKGECNFAVHEKWDTRRRTWGREAEDTCKQTCGLCKPTNQKILVKPNSTPASAGQTTPIVCKDTHIMCLKELGYERRGGYKRSGYA